MILDASSTAVYIAKALKEKNNLTVITNSIEIVMELLDAPGVTVISTGGVSREGSFALVGPQTDRMLKSYHVDKAVISCKGFDLDNGFMDSDELHANNKRTMLKAAREIILAADVSKFEKSAFITVGTLSDITTVVTDEQPGEEWLKKFGEYNVECIYPE